MKFVSARRISAACIVSAASVAAAALPSAASAAAVRCSGAPSIGGQGSSLQKVAQEKIWIPAFTTGANSLACAGGTKQGDGKKVAVAYNPSGSGAGLRSWGIETKEAPEINFTTTNAFVGTDEPPNEGQAGEFEKQENSPEPESLETIPVAQEAVAIIVNLPEAEGVKCTAESKAPGTTGRLAITNAQLQGILSGGIKSWGGLTGGVAGNELKPAACGAQPIGVVVRQDQSGTTHIIKRYLNLINPNPVETASGPHTWGELSEGALNTVWPTATEVIKPAAKGGGEEINTVLAKAGRIGYVNVAEAREKGGFVVPPAGGPGTSKFWVELENSAKGSGAKEKVTFTDPAVNGPVEAAGESNCAKTAYTNGENPFPPPEPTEFWDKVTTSVPGPGALKEKGYALCGLTYILAPTHYAFLTGKGATEAEATSVENYLTFVTSKKGGDAELAKDDYSPLPKTVIKIAEKGASKVTF